ncbi:11100_t:CDS:1, partial [Racocetra persica]
DKNYTELPLVSLTPATLLKHSSSAEVICVIAKMLPFEYSLMLVISTHGPCSVETFNAILAIDVLKKTVLGTK